MQLPLYSEPEFQPRSFAERYAAQVGDLVRAAGDGYGYWVDDAAKATGIDADLLRLHAEEIAASEGIVCSDDFFTRPETPPDPFDRMFDAAWHGPYDGDPADLF